jgi:hypothetical protein
MQVGDAQVGDAQVAVLECRARLKNEHITGRDHI